MPSQCLGAFFLGIIERCAFIFDLIESHNVIHQEYAAQMSKIVVVVNDNDARD